MVLLDLRTPSLPCGARELPLTKGIIHACRRQQYRPYATATLRWWPFDEISCFCHVRSCGDMTHFDCCLLVRLTALHLQAPHPPPPPPPGLHRSCRNRLHTTICVLLSRACAYLNRGVVEFKKSHFAQAQLFLCRAMLKVSTALSTLIWARFCDPDTLGTSFAIS